MVARNAKASESSPNSKLSNGFLLSINNFKNLKNDLVDQDESSLDFNLYRYNSRLGFDEI